MKLVIDASVAIKWVLADKQPEPGTEMAEQLLAALDAGMHQLLQPPHWIVEVVGVIARRHPDLVTQSLATLRRLQVEIETGDASLLRAAGLADRLKQHMFDTLYHAVALEHGATLITADEKYLAASYKEGSIQSLQSVTQV